MEILFLAADPTDATRLRLGEEMHEIQDKLQLAKFRDKFVIHQRWSIRPSDISQALLSENPEIVHFSGHGLSDGALCFENETGQLHIVEPEALASLFEQFTETIVCVILNACYSSSQAEAIAKHIPYVIGMSHSIGDKAAIAFSIGFYQAIGAGRPIKVAYKLGCVQIRLQNIPEYLTPILHEKSTLDKKTLQTSKPHDNKESQKNASLTSGEVNTNGGLKYSDMPVEKLPIKIGFAMDLKTLAIETGTPLFGGFLYMGPDDKWGLYAYQNPFPDPPVNLFIEWLTDIIYLFLTDSSNEEPRDVYKRIYHNNCPWEKHYLFSCYEEAVKIASILVNSPRLAETDEFRDDLFFINSELRVFRYQRKYFLKGIKGWVVIPENYFSHLGQKDLGNNRLSFKTKIKDITGSNDGDIFFDILNKRREIITDKSSTIDNLNSKPVYDVFISHKSQDYKIAKSLYDFLIEKNFRVFLSEESLPALGSADFMKNIDDAMENSKHMILICSKLEFVHSTWVEAEWRIFINEIRSGRKKGNFLTIVDKGISPQELPISLRYYEVMFLDNETFSRLPNYLV
jgi:hypothetical protein